MGAKTSVKLSVQVSAETGMRRGMNDRPGRPVEIEGTGP